MYSRDLNGFLLNNQDTQWVALDRYVFKRSKWVFPLIIKIPNGLSLIGMYSRDLYGFFLNNQDTQWVLL